MVWQGLGSGRRGQVRCAVLAIELPVELSIRSLLDGGGQSTRVSSRNVLGLAGRHAMQMPPWLQLLQSYLQRDVRSSAGRRQRSRRESNLEMGRLAESDARW